MNGKRDLEIIFKLIWNNRPLCADDCSNIVGMHDVPSTTLTWENFKSYLLKNSGSSCDDIKVTYVDNDDKEIDINSQEQFHLAMYSFRKRARNGDMIPLKVHKITCAQKKNEAAQKCCNLMEFSQPDIAEEPITYAETDDPPKWFLKYMKRFKREIVEETSSLVSRNISKLVNTNQSLSARKTKSETHKKPRKLSAPSQNASSGHIEELKKYMKFESKLEKLEQKSLKIKAKKLALKVKEGVVPSAKNRLIGLAPTEAELYMNATSVESHMPTIPRMLGGETFLQQWKVINSGSLQWTNETELRFAWGSKSLIPLEKKVLCPHLLPGEEGIVSVLLEIPVTPGNYECYWHFHHKGVRFGHWLGCLVKVDEPPIKLCHLPKPENYQSQDNEKDVKPVLDNIDTLFAEKLNINPSSDITSHLNVFMNSIKFENKLDSGNSSRSSSVSNEGYVFVVNDEQSNNQEKESNSEEDIEKIENEEKKESDDNNEEKELDIDENIAPEYAYIVYNGEKFPFHKKFLTDEYFQKAEKVRNVNQNQPEKMCGSNSTPNLSNVNSEELSAKQRNVSESSSTRLFVFPQHSPGFEVVYPDDTKDQVDSLISLESNMMACNSSTNGQSNQNDSRMSSSRNSLLVNTDSQSACPCNVSQTCLDSFQYNSGDCEYNYCGPRECSSAPCPYKVEQHIYAGCTSRSCNVLMSSSIPKTQTPSPPATENVFRGESASNTNCTTPQMSESVHSGQPHVHRPPHVWNSRPENLITGAAILASSAMSTARSMMNMVIQNGGGKWINGHWVVDNPNTKRENGLQLLAEMGFLNRDLNATLMARYNDDVHRVISELIL